MNYHHGQIAYEGFSTQMNGKFPDGTPIPSWTDIPDELRDAWSKAADAVIDAVLGVHH